MSLNINDINSINALESEKFRILLEENLESILLKKFGIKNSKDLISKQEVRELIDKAIDNIKRTYLMNRKPNFPYQLGDVAYLPYSPQYFIECVVIDTGVNNGKTSKDELLGTPEELHITGPDGKLIDPVGQIFEDGGITWKVHSLIEDLDNLKDVTIQTELIEGTDVVLRGLTQVQGTLSQAYSNSNVDATKNVLKLAPVYPGYTRYDNNNNIIQGKSFGIEVGADAIICSTEEDNVVGIRGNGAYEKNDKDSGGIKFGEWAITGIIGNKENMITLTDNNGALLPYYTTDTNNSVSYVRPTYLGKENIKYKGLYVENIVANKIDVNKINFNDSTKAKTISAYSNNNLEVPLLAYNKTNSQLLYNSDVKVNMGNQSITALNFKGTADVATKVKTIKNNTTTAFLLGVKSGTTNTPYYDSTVYLGADEGTIVAKKFDGVATSATKATNDDAGNVIKTTYVKDISIDAAGNITLTKGNGTTSTSNVNIKNPLNNKFKVISTRTRRSSEPVY